jgi:hypothetical protein
MLVVIAVDINLPIQKHVGSDVPGVVEKARGYVTRRSSLT